ncbi:unnamed protein product [Prorocentrum cordatum]|uniref:Uncharacterized protein n=1 Tax=Prorocentrum cordatum TaxID=2364126 RepID=A0ABN9TRW6_9DINO|nr:unnamed protein product [Polarella glacialis]
MNFVKFMTDAAARHLHQPLPAEPRALADSADAVEASLPEALAIGVLGACSMQEALLRLRLELRAAAAFDLLLSEPFAHWRRLAAERRAAADSLLAAELQAAAASLGCASPPTAPAPTPGTPRSASESTNALTQAPAVQSPAGRSSPSGGCSEEDVCSTAREGGLAGAPVSAAFRPRVAVAASTLAALMAALQTQQHPGLGLTLADVGIAEAWWLQDLGLPHAEASGASLRLAADAFLREPCVLAESVASVDTAWHEHSKQERDVASTVLSSSSDAAQVLACLGRLRATARVPPSCGETRRDSAGGTCRASSPGSSQACAGDRSSELTAPAGPAVSSEEVIATPRGPSGSSSPRERRDQATSGASFAGLSPSLPPGGLCRATSGAGDLAAPLRRPCSRRSTARRQGSAACEGGAGAELGGDPASPMAGPRSGAVLPQAALVALLAAATARCCTQGQR